MMRIFFILLTTTIYSQNNFKSLNNFIYDYDKQKFEIWVKDSILEFDLNKNLIDKYENPLKSIINLVSIQTIYGHKKGLLVANGSGHLFRKKYRIDNSNIDSFFINSISFEHNDTIFKLGGYGFWTKFKGITYYDKNQKTWESHQLSMIDEKYKGILSPRISKIDDNRYMIFGGKTFDEKKHLIEKYNREVYFLDMSKKEIVKQGSSKLSFRGVQVESNNIILNKSELIILDWKKNKFFNYNTSWSHKVDFSFKIYLINNQFYFIEKKDNTYLLSSLPNEIHNLKVSNSGEIIESNTAESLFIFLIVLILFTVVSVYKKYSTILIKNDKINYRFKSISISKEQKEILYELIKTQKITTNKIHNIISTSELHPNHIYRLIPEMISEIEKSIQLLTGSNQHVFSISKNKMDRRIKEYRLNPYYRIKN